MFDIVFDEVLLNLCPSFESSMGCLFMIYGILMRLFLFDCQAFEVIFDLAMSLAHSRNT